MVRTVSVFSTLILLLGCISLFTISYSFEQIQDPLPQDNEIKNRLMMIDINSPVTDKITVRYFRELGDKALPVIEEVLRNEDVDTRRRGIIVIAFLIKANEYRDEEYVQQENAIISMLIPLIDDEEVIIRKRVTRLLGNILLEKSDEDYRLINSFIKLLSDEDESIRELAAEYLVSIGKENVVPDDLRNRHDRRFVE